MDELTIYNSHIHTFTSRHAPKNFLRLFKGRIIGDALSWLLRMKLTTGLVLWLMDRVAQWTGNDILTRQVRFLKRGTTFSQKEVFAGIQRQYPRGTRFVILPMDMELMDLGSVEINIFQQHKELLELADKNPGLILPFFFVHPERSGIVEAAQRALSSGRFSGVKIYPNLGYPPDHHNLIEIYRFCVEYNKPVMTHCTPFGIWKYGLSEKDRRSLGHPHNYTRILQEFPDLRICLAHFGGQDEWQKHLEADMVEEGENRTWVRWIADLIRSGNYPTLYTDISYTLFSWKPRKLHIDYFDYLKVLLANERIRQHVIFGSDYYMAEMEPLSEKEVSIALRSRLGEELYFHIAHHNPKRYLGIT